MDIISDIIASIKDNVPIKDVYTCAFWTAVISKHCGLSSTFKEDNPDHKTVREAGNLRNKESLKLVQYAKSDNLLEASIGMATINSLIDIDETMCIYENAFDVIAQKGKEKNIVVVGHFPWIPQLKSIANKLWVLEQRLHDSEDLPPEFADKVIPEADVVAITGTAFINHTIDKLLKLSRDKYIVILGPTTPLTSVLFDYGVNVLSGVQVTDPQKLITTITEGAIFRQVKGVRLINMSYEFRKR